MTHTRYGNRIAVTAATIATVAAMSACGVAQASALAGPTSEPGRSPEPGLLATTPALIPTRGLIPTTGPIAEPEPIAEPDPCPEAGEAEPLVSSAVRAQSGSTGVGQYCPPADDGPTRSAEPGLSARPYFDEADWLWNPVPEDPALDPQSEAMVGHLATGDHIANTGDFAVTLRGTEGITEDTPRYPVSFSQEGIWGPDPFAGATIPVPDNTPIAHGSDGHLAVADPISDMVYNLWMAHDGGDSWNAGWGAMTPLYGDGREEHGSSTGSGLARYAAVVRADEIAAGEIPHALFFSTNMAAPDEVRYPATKTDGSNMDGVETPIPEGARVQLDPALDLDTLGLSEGELTVARALQTYGAYVGDNGGARMAFLFEYVPGSSVYEDAGIEGDFAALDGIPWDRLQVLADWNGGQDPDEDRSGTGSPTRTPSVSDRPAGAPGAAPSIATPGGGSGDAPSTAAPDDAVDTAVVPLRDIGEPTGRSTGGRTLAVGDGGSYSSIQEAVDAARPGDTVEIAAGTYDGFSVDTQGSAQKWITIQAEDGAEVLIEGGGGSDQGLIDVNGAAYLRMIGLTVRGSGTHGVYGAGTDHVVLRDCEVAGSRDGGIVILDSSDLLIEGCEVHGNNARGTSASNEAISVVNTDGFEIVGNDVRDNGEEGIDAKYEARNGIIHGNRATGNRGPNIYIDSAHDIEVIDNLAAGATEASKSGIGLAVENYSDTLRLADITVRGNRIEGNAGAGVDFWIEGSGTMSDITVEDNFFSDNGRGAITFNTDSFSGVNSIIGNLFSGDDEPPAERSGFRFTGNALTDAVTDVLGG